MSNGIAAPLSLTALACAKHRMRDHQAGTMAPGAIILRANGVADRVGRAWGFAVLAGFPVLTMHVAAAAARAALCLCAVLSDFARAAAAEAPSPPTALERALASAALARPAAALASEAPSPLCAAEGAPA